MNNSGLTYAGQVVKEHDPDRFLLSLFMPEDVRRDLWALFAFNHEIAKTREIVTETQLGLIRLQWWRDAVQAIYEGEEVKGHEVLDDLARVIRARNLPQEPLDALIYAREFDLENVLPSDILGLLNYADYTAAPLMRLAVIMTGCDPDMEPVQPIAVNYAITGILRAVPFHASQQRCYLPEEELKKQSVTVNKLYQMTPEENLRAVIKVVAENFAYGVKPDNPFLKLSQKLAEMHIGAIRRLDYDVFHPKMAAGPAFKELRLCICRYV